MQKYSVDWYERYKDSQAHVAQLQVMLAHVYNKRLLWMRLFWLQSITAYLILMFN